MKYRREIDGLRAVAVIPVILFHAGVERFGGGFVGVDVFFVISGYLITSLILVEKEAASFSVAAFYERRFRRILPALFLIMFVSLVAAWYLMLPRSLAEFGRSAVAVSLFVSNIFFWKQTDYFGPAVTDIPLLHTWSLAVEEQFYVIFPLLIVSLWRFGKQWILAVVTVLGLLSFVAAEIGSHKFPDANFYVITSRGWELMLGALAALYLSKGHSVRGWLAQSASLVGLAAILFAVFGFSELMPYPGRYTLVPTLGTVLVILFATSGTLVGRLLSLRWIVAIGLISYSAYLWHVPLFVFTRQWLLAEPSAAVMWMLSGSSLLFGFLSWRYIEKPFRDRRRFTQSQIFTLGSACTSVFIVCGYLLSASDGFIGRFGEDATLVQEGDRVVGGGYVRTGFLALLDKPFDATDTRPRLLLIGDSFAEDFFNAALENRRLDSYQIGTRYVPTVCQMVTEDEVVLQTLIRSEDWELCKEADSLSRASSRIAEADVVILAADWKEWSATRITATIARLHLRQNQRIIVVGAKDFGKITLRSYLGRTSDELRSLRHEPDWSKRRINDTLKTTLPPDVFVDQYEIVCGAMFTCPLFTPDDLHLISYDGSHLTLNGARFVGARLFSAEPLKGL